MVELDVFTCPLDGIALIEASAGTGKTWNICGLYLRQLLEKDLPVSRLLVVTFTRAATAELSARIRARILAALRALEGGAAEDEPFTASLLVAARSAVLPNHIAASNSANVVGAVKLKTPADGFPVPGRPVTPSHPATNVIWLLVCSLPVL